MSTEPSASSSEDAPVAPLTWSAWFARWAPPVLWAVCISWFSTGAFSARSTHTYIDPVLRLLFGDLSLESLRFLHAVIRKSAHFLEYAVLGILLCRALTPPGASPPRAFVVRAIVYCTLYATVDELHQTLEVTRTGSPSDVALDALGATIGTLLFAGFRGVRRRARAAPFSVRSRA